MHKTSQAVRLTVFPAGFTVIAGLSAILAALRFFTNISFSGPLHIITSGSEEQSFLSLWKFVHGLPVYTDPHKIPFTSSYVNWLFYFCYGGLIKAGLALTHLSDAWMPALGRLSTLLFSIAGFVAGYGLWKNIFPEPPGAMKGLGVLVPFYLFFGPLPAFWPFTTRPDMAALFFELLAFYVFIRGFQGRPGRAALLAGCFAYLAWSFKQTNITVFLGLLVFSLMYDRPSALRLLGVMGILCCVTLWAGGEEYRRSTLFSLPVPGFSASRGMSNFFYYMAECVFALPGYLAIGAVLFSRAFRQKIREDKISFLCFLIAIISSIYGFASAFKIGASENYFIPASIFVTFFFFRAASFEELNPGIMRVALIVSCAVNAVFILLILSGATGEISKRYEHRQNIALFECSKSLPRPVYSQAVYLNLPWMLGGEPGGRSFIPGYTYWTEKGREKVYERGGIEGLIKEGYFGSLLLKKSHMNEIFGTASQTEEGLKYYDEMASSCPETHMVFIKRTS